MSFSKDLERKLIDHYDSSSKINNRASFNRFFGIFWMLSEQSDDNHTAMQCGFLLRLRASD